MNKKLNKIQMVLLFLVVLAAPVQAYAASCGLQDSSIPSIGECEGNMALDTLISSSICIVRAVLGEVMFEMYCGILDEMKGPLDAALVMWVTFYAIAVIFGIGNASGRDVTIRILKIAIIYAVATNADLFSTFLYEFFIHGLLDGVSTFLFEIDAGVVNANDVEGVFGYTDQLFHKVLGTDKLLGFSILVSAFASTGIGVIVSMLLMMGILAMIQAFFRILITYAVALLALSFILMFAPLFMIFAMFERTFNLFQGWLAAIISYTIQPLVVLAFIFLFASVDDLSGFISELQLDGAGVEKIDPNKVHKLDLSFQVLESVNSGFTKLTGDAATEDATEFTQDYVDGVYYALAFFILNAVMNSFLQGVPQFAQTLGRFEGSFAVPAIGMSGGGGFHRPEQFLTGTSAWKKAETGIKNYGGIAGGNQAKRTGVPKG